MDPKGVSLSVLKLDELRQARLAATTLAPAWQAAGTRRSTQPRIISPPAAGAAAATPQLATVSVDAVVASKVLTAVAAALSAAEAELTEFDRVAGDGDCGMTMQRGGGAISEVAAQLAAVAHVDLADLCGRLADAVSLSMGGTSGALFEIGLRAGATALVASAKGTTQGPLSLTAAFTAGVAAIKFYSGADRGYRTMLDALLPAADSVSAAALDTPDKDIWASVAGAAAAGANKTKTLTALAGRSNYIPAEQLAGIPDPGAVAVSIIINAGYAAAFDEA